MAEIVGGDERLGTSPEGARLRLLGGFDLTVDTSPIALSPTAQRLFALLALCRPSLTGGGALAGERSAHAGRSPPGRGRQERRAPALRAFRSAAPGRARDQAHGGVPPARRPLTIATRRRTRR